MIKLKHFLYIAVCNIHFVFAYFSIYAVALVLAQVMVLYIFRTYWNEHILHRTIPLCARLKPISGWLFPIQLESLYIYVKNAYFVKDDIRQDKKD